MGSALLEPEAWLVCPRAIPQYEASAFLRLDLSCLHQKHCFGFNKTKLISCLVYPQSPDFLADFNTYTSHVCLFLHLYWRLYKGKLPLGTCVQTIPLGCLYRCEIYLNLLKKIILKRGCTCTKWTPHPPPPLQPSVFSFPSQWLKIWNRFLYIAYIFTSNLLLWGSWY